MIPEPRAASRFRVAGLRTPGSVPHPAMRLRRNPPGPLEWDRYLAERGRSFWFATMLMPAAERARLAGVYAYCRFTDDLVDGEPEVGESVDVSLEQWLALSRAAYDGATTGVALVDRVMRDMASEGVPFRYASELVEGMRMDLAPRRFATLGELSLYSHRVASVVGLWLTELFGVHDEWTLERAARLGHAMQLTNIVRDVGEDWDRGRVYLPRDMMLAHGVDDDDLQAMRAGARVTPEFAALLEELMTQADGDYDLALQAIPRLPEFFRPAVAVAARVYGGIHDSVRAIGHDTMRHRAMTSTSDKIRLARRALAEVGCAGLLDALVPAGAAT